MNGLLLRKARVHFDGPIFPLESLGPLLAEGFRRLGPLPPRARVAVAAGSRGIANIEQITRETVAALRAMGAEPFVIPAMGSHGGATAEGQREVLASYGITEERMGCPIVCSMEVVPLDSRGLEHELFIDAHAAAAGRIVLINRIKPHTDYHGSYESGLTKMAVIGLGKVRQASIMHGFGVRGLRDLIPPAAARIFSTGRVWSGIGIVENARDETAVVEVIPGGRIMEREPELLEFAHRNMPRLPADRIDVLIVDEMGKNISGAGIDTNIIGRMKIPGEAEPASPSIRSIVVCGLTPESHGNAVGVGLADVITERLFQQIDRAVTATNLVTSGFTERGKIPVAGSTDAEAYAIALRSCGKLAPGAERVVRIKNTLHLTRVAVSSAIAAELQGRPDITWEGDFASALDDAGSLSPWK